MNKTQEEAQLLSTLIKELGEPHVLLDEHDQSKYLTDWRGLCRGEALAVVLPGTTQEVATVVAACHQAGVPIVPQGGNTGQVAGATASSDGRSVVLVTTRLRRIRNIDVSNATITAEAGCTLLEIQEAARSAGMLFPLSLGAEGSCTIGGNLATNAGGTQVLRYGNARELALGLEVVLADGKIWHGLQGLRKDNTGYDLRNLIIGSEGTLGIITAATLRLFALPKAQCTAFVALPSIHRAGAFLTRCRLHFDSALTGFELMSRACLQLVTKTYPQLPTPFQNWLSPWYALLELSDSESEEHARDRFEAVLAEALEANEAEDIAIAQNLSHSAAMWHLRESITLALAEDGKCLKHDISLPVSGIPDFVERMDALLQDQFPGVRIFAFGHLGDGNLHYNVARPLSETDEALHSNASRISALVNDSVHILNGSISAEQGIGRQRTRELIQYKDPVALAMMRAIKKALDPTSILNPGVLLATQDESERRL